MIDVFVFSDPGSLELGSKWVDEISEELRTCKVMLILCSEQSINRRWINFEAGAAWCGNIPLIPICHTGLAKGDLPLPLNLVQGINANYVTDLQSLYAKIAKALGSTVPTTDFVDLAARVAEFERDYGFHWKVRDHVAELTSAIPDVALIFAPSPETKSA